MSDTEKRHTFQIAPNATATFSTQTPDPRTVEILQEVVKLAMEYKKPTALGRPCKTPIKMEGQVQEAKKSVGELRVRTDFNVTGSDVIAEIKAKSAELINLCENLKAKDGRLASLAQTAYEEAAMWAVKAATA